MDQRAGDSGGEDGSDGRKGGKRELSTSKRAAQNRAAQVRENRGLLNHLAVTLGWLSSKVFRFPVFLGDKDSLLTDDYSGRSDSAKKDTSKISRHKSENSITSVKATRLFKERITNYATTSSLCNPAS